MSADSSPEQIVLRAIREALLEDGRAELPGWGVLSVEHRPGRLRDEADNGEEGWTIEPPEEVIVFHPGPVSHREPDPAHE